MQIKDLIVTGDARIIGNLYTKDGLVGGGAGGSGSDGGGGLTYSLAWSGRTLTLKGSDGSSSNVTIPDANDITTYGVATSSALGLVKSGTDISVDGSGNVSVVDGSHNHSAGNITSGTLAIARGGTGATSAAGIIANIGAMDLTSAQTASGLKTFSGGIKIGGAKLTFDSSTQAVTLIFD